MKKGKVTTRKQLVSCLNPPPLPPVPFPGLWNLYLKTILLNDVTPKIEKKKWSLQALGACKRFSWKACIAVCRCRMFDSWCTSTYKVFQVPTALLCKAVCYTAYFRLIEIIQKIVRKVMINWKTFAWQMHISFISLLTVSVMLESWKCPADMRTCLSKQVPITKLDCRLYVARLGHKTEAGTVGNERIRSSSK